MRAGVGRVMDTYRDTAARARQEARAAAWCVPVEEAGVVIATLLASTPALALHDFFRADASAAPAHLCRRVLFARAGVPPSALTAFDAACTAWLAAPPDATLHAAVAELRAHSTAPLAALSPLAACCAVEAALARAHLAAHHVDALTLYRGATANTTDDTLTLATTSLVAARRSAHGRGVVCSRAVPPTRVLMCHHTNGALSARTHAYVVLCDCCDDEAAAHLVRTPPATRRERILCALLRVRLYVVQEPR